MENTIELNLNLAKTLNMIKGYRVGSTSTTPDKLVINFEDKQFVLTITEVEKIDNLFGAIDKYLR